MRYTIQLNISEDTNKIEAEEKEKFLRAILEILEVPLDFWSPEEPLSFETRKRLASEIANYNIEVINDIGGDLEIYKDKTLQAKMFKPLYKIKKDIKQIDPRRKFYLEMEIEIISDLIPEE